LLVTLELKRRILM